MDVERIRIAGCELAQSRDPHANLPNASEWATAVRIIERLDRYDANATRPANRPTRTAPHAGDRSSATGHGPRADQSVSSEKEGRVCQ